MAIIGNRENNHRDDENPRIPDDQTGDPGDGERYSAATIRRETDIIYVISAKRHRYNKNQSKSNEIHPSIFSVSVSHIVVGDVTA